MKFFALSDLPIGFLFAARPLESCQPKRPEYFTGILRSLEKKAIPAFSEEKPYHSSCVIQRVVTQGKELDAISHEITAAIQGGSRVLVRAARLGDALPSKPNGDKGAVADWAMALSQKHRLVWKRVGLDVIFARPDN